MFTYQFEINVCWNNPNQLKYSINFQIIYPLRITGKNTEGNNHNFSDNKVET